MLSAQKGNIIFQVLLLSESPVYMCALVYLTKFLNHILRSCKEHFKGLISVYYIH